MGSSMDAGAPPLLVDEYIKDTVDACPDERLFRRGEVLPALGCARMGMDEGNAHHMTKNSAFSICTCAPPTL